MGRKALKIVRAALRDMLNDTFYWAPLVTNKRIWYTKVDSTAFKRIHREDANKPAPRILIRPDKLPII